ncbi:uncharacterized protein LOC125837332 [Solanum verrucosum]|uniref:uncharacterized protein LOC125837332 n=1 Tax=Solanum verrucosum TaxID=315347 RepID=UPI0020D01E24|nr:uncharacterized protein LOC125837332 [Solanum verrucosum]
MVNLTKPEFVTLHSSSKNYLSWMLDAEIQLDAMDLGDTIKDENKASKQNCAKAMILLRHHLDGIRKIEYLTVKDPLVLWSSLKERYDHLNMQQYREKGFKKYFELISHLLVAEQNNNLLIKNHEKPTRSESLPEVNEAYAHHARRGKGPGHDHGCGCGCGCGRGHNYGQERKKIHGVNHSSNKNHIQKEKGKDEKRRAGCFRCGGRGYYARDCRTPKYLIEIFQESL